MPAVDNLPEDKSFPHFKGNDPGKAFSFLHVEDVLCRHISSDPVQSSLSKNSNSLFLLNSCIHLKSTPLIRLLRKTSLTHNRAHRWTEKASNPSEMLMFISTVNIQCSFVLFELFSHIRAARYPNFLAFSPPNEGASITVLLPGVFVLERCPVLTYICYRDQR